MKCKRVIPFLLYVFPITLITSSLGAGPERSIDISKCRADRSSAWLQSVPWPAEDRISSASLAPSEVKEDCDALDRMLRIVLRPPAFSAFEKQRSAIKAVPSFHENNDYLLVRYEVPGMGEMQIQDWKALTITFLPADSYQPPLPATSDASRLSSECLTNYLKSMARLLLNVPSDDSPTSGPKVQVLTMDIGPSRLGWIVFDPSYPPPRHWYSGMSWWSDGRNVSFLVGKLLLLNPGLDINRMAGPLPGFKAPRKFIDRRR